MPYILAIAMLVSAFLIGGQIAYYKRPSLQSTPIPTQIVLPSPTPTQETIIYTPPTNNIPIVDCIGPDYKHLQLTQKACDDFNAAWGNKPIITQNPIQQSYQAAHNAAQAQVNQECDNIVGVTDSICLNNCLAVSKLDGDKCPREDMDAFKQCLADSTTKMMACDDVCSKNLTDGLANCAK